MIELKLLKQLQERGSILFKVHPFVEISYLNLKKTVPYFILYPCFSTEIYTMDK